MNDDKIRKRVIEKIQKGYLDDSNEVALDWFGIEGEEGSSIKELAEQVIQTTLEECESEFEGNQLCPCCARKMYRVHRGSWTHKHRKLDGIYRSKR